MNIPITTITGTLGAGKTTIIRNLIENLPKDYNVVWLKNEYGDLNVDTILAKSKNIQTKEIINGCLCCVLIGKLKDAIQEILKDYQPDRIIIETAGTAYPYPIIHEITEIQGIKNDGVVKVIDALNFEQLDDRSEFAKQQAHYIDLIVINKTDLAGEEKLESVNDAIFEIYPDNPKIYTKDGKVNSELIFGLDLKISSGLKSPLRQQRNYKSFSPPLELVYTVGKGRLGGVTTSNQNKHSDISKTLATNNAHSANKHHEENHEHIETFTINLESKNLTLNAIEAVLQKLTPSDFIRIKGIIQSSSKSYILNYVLGKIDWEAVDVHFDKSQIIFMGKSILGLKSKIQKELNTI